MDKSKKESYYTDKKTGKKILRQVYTSRKIEELYLKRDCIMSNYLHHVSKYIINLCVARNIGTLVIGYNPGWKDGVDMNKVANQNFVYIPFAKLIDMLIYKGFLSGVYVKTRKEPYTSLCSALDLEPIKRHNKYVGKRLKRGMFRTATGLVVHSDANGSYNTFRNEFGDQAFVKGILRNLKSNRGTRLCAEEKITIRVSGS